jgi:hypothetical protein
MDRSAQLSALISSLESLVSVLRLDPKSRWATSFESCLEQAKSLQATGVTQNELNSISATVMDFFGGSGSFNDYGAGTYDPASGRYSPIPGMEGLDSLSAEVHDRALALRVVGDAI